MIVWTWIKRSARLFYRTIWFWISESCCFMTGYLVTFIFAIFAAVKVQTLIPIQLALGVCFSVAIVHRIFVIGAYFLQRDCYDKRQNEQIEKRRKYIRLVKECITKV